eukprot:1158409-Pelagomonas_calceolata.AAC.5
MHASTGAMMSPGQRFALGSMYVADYLCLRKLAILGKTWAPSVCVPLPLLAPFLLLKFRYQRRACAAGSADSCFLIYHSPQGAVLTYFISSDPYALMLRSAICSTLPNKLLKVKIHTWMPAALACCPFCLWFRLRWREMNSHRLGHVGAAVAEPRGVNQNATGTGRARATPSRLLLVPLESVKSFWCKKAGKAACSRGLRGGHVQHVLVQHHLRLLPTLQPPVAHLGHFHAGGPEDCVQSRPEDHHPKRGMLPPGCFSHVGRLCNKKVRLSNKHADKEK